METIKTPRQRPLTMPERRAHALMTPTASAKASRPSDRDALNLCTDGFECEEEDRLDRIEAQQRDLHRSSVAYFIPLLSADLRK